MAKLPRPTPRYPLATRRLFGQIRSADVACPACGCVGKLRENPRLLHKGIWVCRDCHKRWALGIVYWPLGTARTNTKAEDQIPTVEESAELAELRYHAIVKTGTQGVYTGGHAIVRRVNRLCTCGVCPVHGEGEPNAEHD